MQSGWNWLCRLSLLIGVCVLASSCTQIGGNSNPAVGSLYDHVVSSGKLRCGYVIYNPGCIKDPNTGKLSGIGVEAMEIVAKKLGLRLEWTEEVGWGTMIEGLQSGRYDIVV